LGVYAHISLFILYIVIINDDFVRNVEPIHKI